MKTNRTQKMLVKTFMLGTGRGAFKQWYVLAYRKVEAAEKFTTIVCTYTVQEQEGGPI